LLDNPKDYAPLEEIIDEVLQDPETIGRTTIKFMATRMVSHGCRYRVQEVARAASRMPHGADALAPLLAASFDQNGLQDWFLDYACSGWASHEWALAQYVRMFPTSRSPRKPLRTFVEERLRDANTGVQMLAVSSQRLSGWDEPAARDACRYAQQRAPHPHARRIIALAAAGAGETRATLRRWLKADHENYPTLRTLEDSGFKPPKVRKDFEG
jgi:hypothetical protein